MSVALTTNDRSGGTAMKLRPKGAPTAAVLQGKSGERGLLPVPRPSARSIAGMGVRLRYAHFPNTRIIPNLRRAILHILYGMGRRAVAACLVAHRIFVNALRNRSIAPGPHRFCIHHSEYAALRPCVKDSLLRICADIFCWGKCHFAATESPRPKYESEINSIISLIYGERRGRARVNALWPSRCSPCG